MHNKHMRPDRHARCARGLAAAFGALDSMSSLCRFVVIFAIATCAMAKQTSSFDDIAYAYVHDTQNSQASLVADSDTEWIVSVLQACSWQMYTPSLEVQKYVISFFDRSSQLVASGQLVESGLYMSAGEGILVCDVTEQVANRIRQIQ